MVSCKHCTTQNSLDSAFCKRCGKGLDETQLREAKARTDAALAKAFDDFAQGRTNESALAAEAVLVTDPDSLRALSLRAMVLERRGLLAEALETYELVLARDPDSALDRIKATQLRTAISIVPRSEASLTGRWTRAWKSDRRGALIAGAGACLFVVSVGALAAALTTQPNQERVAQSSAPKEPIVETFAPADAEPQEASTKRLNVAADAFPQQPAGVAPTDVPALRTGVPASSSLPKPTMESIDPLANTRPIVPDVRGLDIRPILPGTNAPISPPRAMDPEPANITSDTPKTAEPKPYIDIRVSDGKTANVADNTVTANGIEALLRAARGQYQVGNYQAAAGSYERALRAGADPASVNQRLAQCYEKLGRQSEAIEAYGRAISAIESAIANGSGNSERLKAALESSKQAQRALQGG